MMIIVVIAIIVVALLIINEGWVKSELALLESKIEAGKQDATTMADDAKKVANNAKGIASNALSSAQRAESKLDKHITTEATDVVNDVKANVKTVEEEVKNA